jgi:hypothetical protein
MRDIIFLDTQGGKNNVAIRTRKTTNNTNNIWQTKTTTGGNYGYYN